MSGERFDVVVAGGGTAGIAAAVTAARCGARVLLVERGPALGGNVAHALVHTFCGLYLPPDGADGPPVHAHPGFPKRFAESLRLAGGAGDPERAGKVFVLPIHPEALERHAATVCAAEPSLAVWLDAEVRGARLARERREGNQLEIARGGGGDDGHEILAVEGRVVVDASGDAAIAALGGADASRAPADELQCPSYIFRLAGIAPGTAVGFARLQLSVATAGAVRAQALPPACESVLLRPGPRPDEVYVTLNVARPSSWDPLDETTVAALEAASREAATALLAYLRETRPAFREARLLAWPRRLGIRETRRVDGRAVVTRDDVLGGLDRHDEVARSTWPIELWNDHRRALFELPAGPSSIPLGALVSRSHPRLAMAGRCVSATHEALGALRVIGTAMATGEAAGVAAALAADADDALDAVVAPAVRARLAELADR